MTATGHAIIGVVIAAKIGNPYLAVPLALVSHLAADAFPHWDTGTNKKSKTRERLFIDSFIDVAISLTLPLILGPYLNPSINFIYMYIIVFAAQFFDWVTAPYVFFKQRYAPFTWPYKFQMVFDNRLDKPLGVIVQALILIFLVAFAKLI